MFEEQVLDKLISCREVTALPQVPAELKKMFHFDTTRYLAETSILDIEARLKSRMKAVETMANEEQS